MVEGDDQSIDIVTYEDVTVPTKRGPVTKRMLVPVRPLEDNQEAHSGEPSTQTVTNDSMAHADVGTAAIDEDESEEPTPRQKNQVCFA